LRIIASAQRLLKSGYRSLNVETIARDAGASVVTVRAHWLTVAQTLGEFAARGIMTHTGPLSPRDAAVQVLILPVLLVIWGLSIAVIAAIVA